jgi:hypothetical protein
MPSRTSLLLAALVALLVARFLIIPWTDRMSESRDSLRVLTDRLDRSEAVFSNRELLTNSLTDLEASVAAMRVHYPEVEDLSAFQLTQQQEVNRLLQQAGLQLVVFDWVLSGDVEGSTLGFSRFRLQVRGEVLAQAKLMAAIESEFLHAAVREMGVAPVNAQQIARQGGSSDLNTVIDVYFRKRP